MRPIDKGFEAIVEYHAPNPFEHFGTSAIVPSEIIGQMSLQALQNWMYTITTPAFHNEITAKEEEYRQFLRECGVTESNDNPFYQYTVARSERAVSYDELASLVEASQDIAAEQYRGMTADNWRDYFDETR